MYILHVRSETDAVGIQINMIFGWLWWPNDPRGKCGPNFMSFAYNWRKTPEKTSSRKLTRPGIEPGPDAWEASMLPLDHSGGPEVLGEPLNFLWHEYKTPGHRASYTTCTHCYGWILHPHHPWLSWHGITISLGLKCLYRERLGSLSIYYRRRQGHYITWQQEYAEVRTIMLGKCSA